MRERGRQAHAAQAPRWNAQAPAASLRFGAMGTVPKALVIGIAMLLVFLAVRYLLEFRRTLPFPATGDVHWYIGTEQPRVARLTLRARQHRRGQVQPGVARSTRQQWQIQAAADTHQ